MSTQALLYEADLAHMGFRRCVVALIAVGALACAGNASALDIPILSDLLGNKPGAETAEAANVTTSGARLNGMVHPNGRGTDYVFEYGPTAAYGAKTSKVSVGGSGSWRTVAANLSGLSDGTTYHFRIVATNSKGTTRGDDLTFTTVAAPPPPPGEEPPGADGEGGSDGESGNGESGSGEGGSGEGGSGEGGNGNGEGNNGNRDFIADGEGSGTPAEPELGASVLVAPGDGVLRIRRPGGSGFVPLEFGSELPVGSEVDASEGSIALTSALPNGKLQTGRFGGGRFVIRQGRRGYIDLYLRGRACRRPPATSSLSIARASKKKRERRLWGKDHGGRFRTHGKNSHATVRGTRWEVIDTCKGTLTRVTSGSVVVTDRVRRKRVVVEAGERYLARPRR
jgi:hypothetical protein